MNNQELELKIKEIINIPNMFDMIIAAQNFEKEYRKSDFYKITKMPLNEVIKNAKVYYTLSYQGILEKIQSLINDLDFNKVNDLLDQFSSTFEQENNDTLTMINELKDFKNIVNK